MQKRVRNLAAAAMMLTLSGLASANTIPTSGNLAAGDIDYFAFDVTNSGNFTLNLSSSAFDTELFLFRNTLATLIASNDDINYPSNTNSRISNFFLSIGHYIAAIGAFNTTDSEAASGSNPGNTAYGAWSLSIRADNGTANATSVPEPGTIGLLGAGLVVLGLLRRRNATA
jgi:hypothetical protein